MPETITSHTPGPWTSPGWIPTWAYVPVRSPSGLICSVYPAGRNVDYLERAEANARLIAAAPDLLEALMAIIDGPGLSSVPDNDVQALITSAITKATGEASDAK